MKLKVDYYIVPASLLIGAIVTIILAICHLGWNYYLIGLFTSLLTHGMLIKQNYRLQKLALEDKEAITYNPRKIAFSGYALRLLVFVAVFGVIIYKFKDNLKNNASLIITTLCGYLTLKIVLIFGYLIFRKKVDKE